MSQAIQNQITRIQTDRNTLRNWGITAGLVESAATLDDIATAISAITVNGSVNATVKEGESYTIDAGYYKGGTVSGVSGGGNYTLQAKEVTPTKSIQTIASDDGYYGLSGVTVNAIPEAYQDVTSVTATAANVLATKVFVTADGTVTTGTMTNNGAVTKTLDTTTTSYTIPAGYHNGSGKVSVSTETKTATPSTSSQDITPTTGKVLSKVTVNAIPSQYGDATNMTVTSASMLSGVTAIGKDADGNAVTVTGGITTTNAVTVASGSLTAVGSNYTASGSYAQGGNYLASSGTATVTFAKSALGTAAASSVLAGSTFSSSAGIKVDGTMTNNGAISSTMDGLTTDSVTIPTGYTSGGTVSLTSDIADALAAI